MKNMGETSALHLRSATARDRHPDEYKSFVRGPAPEHPQLDHVRYVTKAPAYCRRRLTRRQG